MPTKIMKQGDIVDSRGGFFEDTTIDVQCESFMYCTFVNCKIIGLNNSLATFRRCQFINCTIINWGCNFEYSTFTNLSIPTWDGAHFDHCTLEDVSFFGVNPKKVYCVLDGCYLEFCGFDGLDMDTCILSESSFHDCNFAGADLSGTTLVGTNFGSSNMSQVKYPPLPDPAAWLAEHFERVDDGWKCYKMMGEYYTPPASWNVEAGVIITEHVDPNPYNTCSYGINVGNQQKMMEMCPSYGTYWECLLKDEWLASVVIPVGSVNYSYKDSSNVFRCNKLQLVAEHSGSELDRSEHNF